LADSISGKVYFAGEATHTGGHHGTLHGAMESGLRAAMEILTIVNE
jgi:monoamine oxidase